MTLIISNVSRYTYTSDQRFRAIHKLMSQDYLLQILPVKVGPFNIVLTSNFYSIKIFDLNYSQTYHVNIKERRIIENGESLTAAFQLKY